MNMRRHVWHLENFAFLAIFSPKLVKIVQIIVNDAMKPIESGTFSWSSTVILILKLKIADFRGHLL